MESSTKNIIYTRPFTFQDILSFDHGAAALENYFMFAEYDSNEDLMGSDFVIGDISFPDLNQDQKQQPTYTLIHAFPGDIPMGAVFNQTELYFIGYDVEAKNDDKIDVMIKEWYARVTNGCTDFMESYWYCKQTDDNE